MAKKSPASILKSKGLIPKDWNLRNLSRGQKSWITKLTQPGRTDKAGNHKSAGPLRNLVLHPSEYSSVKTKTTDQKKQARGAALPVVNGRAIVRTGKGGRVSFRRDKLTITEGSGRKMEVWFANSKTFLKQIEKARNRKLKPNQTWGFAIGDRPNNVQHRNFEHLLRYLNDKDDWHTQDATDYISLVLITENRRSVVAHNTYHDEENED